MAITPNQAQTHIILDTSSRVVAKFLYYSNNAAMETNTLKINAETLSFRTFELTVANTSPANFQPNDLLIGQTSNAHARVAHWRKDANVVVVTALTGNTAFSNSEVVVIDRSQEAVTLVDFQVPSRVLTLESVSYNISASLIVEIGFESRYANNDTYVYPGILLTGSGYFGKNALPIAIDNPADISTGNIVISTLGQGLANNVAYSIIAEFRKVAGYAGAPVY